MNTQVKIIYTGGTFGMQESNRGLQPAPDLAKRLRTALASTPSANAQLNDIDWSITEWQPLLDSANIQPADWESIAKACTNPADTQAIVVVHGTDTLAYTGCALAYLLSKIQIPVILTGSQKPLEEKDSDALGNLVGALYASTNAAPGVWVFFHHQLMPAARVVKKDALSFDGFATPRLFSPAKKGSTDLSWQATPRLWSSLYIPIIHLSPGFRVKQLSAMINSQPNAIVFALYGLGTLANQDTKLLETLKTAQQKNIILVAVSQCYIGEIDFNLYAAGAELAELGVMSGQDMTLEATYTKLMVLFRLGYTKEHIKQLFTQSVAGEISTHE